MQPSYLLVSDVDGTLLGDDDALRAFADWFADRRSWLRLAFASGRFLDSLRDSVQSTPLPSPDAVIGGVGTDITVYPSGELIESWHSQVSRDWSADRVRTILADEEPLTLQPPEDQSAFKVSYYWFDASTQEIARLHRKLERGRVAADIVYSSNRDLDVVPRGVNKGTAALFLAATWSIPPDRLIVAGDSGNDLSLFQVGARGIVVANAHEELKQLDDPGVYHAAKPYAAGVLEGLQYWLRQGG